MHAKDRTLDGDGVMLLIHKDIPHITKLEKGFESVWVKVLANKEFNVTSWYRPNGSKVDELELSKVKCSHNGKKVEWRFLSDCAFS